MMGRLNAVASNYFTYKNKYSTVKGVGAAPEAIEQTPVTYDLLFELPWMTTQPVMQTWIKEYATSRYGLENSQAQGVWVDFLNTVLGFGSDGIEEPVEDVWAARPNTMGYAASSWGSSIGYKGHSANSTVANIYTAAKQQKMAAAVARLIGLGETFADNTNYRYDLIEAGSQVMADYAYHLIRSVGEARDAGNDALAQLRREAFLQLILDMDDFKGTHPSFRLGKWTQEARMAAEEVEGATTATPDWYELNNARQLITTWGDKDNCDTNGLRDYSYRSWQGMLRDVYYPRWKYYFDHNYTDPSGGWFLFEWDWAHRLKWTSTNTAKSKIPLKEGETGYSYSREAVGNTLTEARKLYSNHLLPIDLANGTYYAYRAMETDMQQNITIAIDREGKQSFSLPIEEKVLEDLEPVLYIDLNGNGIFDPGEDFQYHAGMTLPASEGGAFNALAVLCLKDGTCIRLSLATI